VDVGPLREARVAVPEHARDRVRVVAGVAQLRGERVPEHVRRDPLECEVLDDRAQDAADVVRAEVRAVLGREDRVVRAGVRGGGAVADELAGEVRHDGHLAVASLGLRVLLELAAVELAADLEHGPSRRLLEVLPLQPEFELVEHVARAEVAKLIGWRFAHARASVRVRERKVCSECSSAKRRTRSRRCSTVASERNRPPLPRRKSAGQRAAKLPTVSS
jgi:hypothetical protein